MKPTLARLDEASRRIIACLARRGPLPRNLLASSTGLSSGSVTRLTRPLVARGYLRELAPRVMNVGRPGVPLEVCRTAGRFVGLTIVPGYLYGVLTGLTGQIGDRIERPIDTSTARSTAREIAAVIDQLDQNQPVDAIGIGLAAAVDVAGNLRAADLLGWSGGNLQADVARQTGIRCVSTNDVDAFAIGEHWFGAGRGSHCFTVLTIGAGVGAGLIIGDHLSLRFEGAAAMLGAAWLPDGRSFHDVLCDAEISARIGALVGHPVTYAEALAAPTPAAAKELDHTVAALGHLVGLATLAYAPDRVLLSGEGIPLVHGRTASLMEALDARRYSTVDLPEVIVKECSPYAWARGAAVTGIQEILLGPQRASEAPARDPARV
ncbi:MAG: ROK family protein [Propioniciclava sp.]